MAKLYDKPLTVEVLRDLPDDAIDYSDIPELDEEFWENAQLTLPEAKTRITLRVDKEVLDFFRAEGQGYQTRINAVLRAYVKAQHDRRKRHTASRRAP